MLLGIAGIAMVVWLVYSGIFSNLRSIDNVFDEIYWADLDQAAASVPFYSTLPTRTDEELFPFTWNLFKIKTLMNREEIESSTKVYSGEGGLDSVFRDEDPNDPFDRNNATRVLAALQYPTYNEILSEAERRFGISSTTYGNHAYEFADVIIYFSSTSPLSDTSCLEFTVDFTVRDVLPTQYFHVKYYYDYLPDKNRMHVSNEVAGASVQGAQIPPKYDDPESRAFADDILFKMFLPAYFRDGGSRYSEEDLGTWSFASTDTDNPIIPGSISDDLYTDLVRKDELREATSAGMEE